MASLSKNPIESDLGTKQLPSDSELVAFRRLLLNWYRDNGRKFPWRKETARSYLQVISEILLQRTQANRIGGVLEEFVAAYPSWRRLAKARISQLEKLLQPLGLSHRRATSIFALAREMARRNGRFPANRETLQTLPGIGQYIANAILLFCHDQPTPLIDVNMARVLERNFGPRKLVDIRYDPYLQKLAARVISSEASRDLNWAILDLAALICLRDKPLCNDCPVLSSCQFANRRTSRQPASIDAII